MMALGVVILAATVQAATFRWYNGAPVYEAGSSTSYLTSGTMYLFSGNGQSALLTGYAAAIAADAGSGITYLTGLDSYVGSATISDATKFGTTTVSGASVTSGRVVWSETTSDASRNYYQVLVSGDNIYISDTKSVTVSGTGNTNITFANTESKNAALDMAGGYSAAGWYAAVPEPTSGLLMLLGMAGLALRRRRA